MRKLMGGVVLALLAGCAAPEQPAASLAQQEAALQPYFNQHGREPVMQCGYASARAGGTEDQKVSRFMACVAQLPFVASQATVAVASAKQVPVPAPAVTQGQGRFCQAAYLITSEMNDRAANNLLEASRPIWHNYDNYNPQDYISAVAAQCHPGDMVTLARGTLLQRLCNTTRPITQIRGDVICTFAVE